MVIERKVYYFEEAGPQNTEKVLEIVKERLNELKIKIRSSGINKGNNCI